MFGLDEPSTGGTDPKQCEVAGEGVTGGTPEKPTERGRCQVGDPGGVAQRHRVSVVLREISAHRVDTPPGMLIESWQVAFTGEWSCPTPGQRDQYVEQSEQTERDIRLRGQRSYRVRGAIGKRQSAIGPVKQYDDVGQLRSPPQRSAEKIATELDDHRL